MCVAFVYDATGAFSFTKVAPTPRRIVGVALAICAAIAFQLPALFAQSARARACCPLLASASILRSASVADVPPAGGSETAGDADTQAPHGNAPFLATGTRSDAGNPA